MKTRTKTRTQLIKDADKYFSLAIRYRDGEMKRGGWVTKCITCSVEKPLKQMQAGHFMSRRYYATRWDDENVNGQCQGCNVWKYGEQYKYSKEIDLKYGEGTAEKLHLRAQVTRKINSQELEEIINDAKEQIRFYERS